MKRRTRTQRGAGSPDQADAGAVVTRDIDERAAVKRVMDLLRIPGPPGKEKAVADYIVRTARRAGVPAACVRFDGANRRVPGAQVGNLIIKLRGTRRGPRRLLSAHMDTVPLAVGAKPVRKGGLIVPAGRTALGADDRSGCGAILTALCELLRRRLPHPPLVFLFTISEEVGLCGARHVATSMLGRPTFGLNFDGGAASQLTLAATGGVHLAIEITGIASHAGGAPERGVSAVSIFASAMDELRRDGWVGKVVKGHQKGTSNVGIVRGGDATNVVLDRLTAHGEARSHSVVFRKRIADRYVRAFRAAARRIRSSEGKRGKADVRVCPRYDPFRLPARHPAVRAVEQAVRDVGLHPVHHKTDGGLDANWLIRHGIPTVTAGAGELDVHTVNERLVIEEYLNACAVALRVACAGR